jgi:hypothetical protein
MYLYKMDPNTDSDYMQMLAIITEGIPPATPPDSDNEGI